MRALPVVLGGMLSAAVAGCILFTGGTDGYAPAAGGGSGCLKPSDCPGQVCCIGLDAGAPVSACQTSCSISWEQACDKASECGDAACFAQTCVIDEASVSVATCGAIPICVQ